MRKNFSEEKGEYIVCMCPYNNSKPKPALGFLKGVRGLGHLNSPPKWRKSLNLAQKVSKKPLLGPARSNELRRKRHGKSREERGKERRGRGLHGNGEDGRYDSANWMIVTQKHHFCPSIKRPTDEPKMTLVFCCYNQG